MSDTSVPRLLVYFKTVFVGVLYLLAGFMQAAILGRMQQSSELRLLLWVMFSAQNRRFFWFCLDSSSTSGGVYKFSRKH